MGLNSERWRTMPHYVTARRKRSRGNPRADRALGEEVSHLSSQRPVLYARSGRAPAYPYEGSVRSLRPQDLPEDTHD